MDEAVPRNEIRLADAGRRFNREWIFRGVTHAFLPDRHTVILGPNGSGKSTLLQVILGSLGTSEGAVTYTINDKDYSPEESLRLFSLATPYLELIEEFTLREMLTFHAHLQPFKAGFSNDDIIDKLYLQEAANRPLRNYSSGMRQRVKLGIALLSDTPFVLLDEPTSNLDANAMDWYANLVSDHMSGRVVIVCSNAQEQEHFFCSEKLNVTDFK